MPGCATVKVEYVVNVPFGSAVPVAGPEYDPE